MVAGIGQQARGPASIRLLLVCGLVLALGVTVTVASAAAQGLPPLTLPLSIGAGSCSPTLNLSTVGSGPAPIISLPVGESCLQALKIAGDAPAEALLPQDIPSPIADVQGKLAEAGAIAPPGMPAPAPPLASGPAATPSSSAAGIGPAEAAQIVTDLKRRVTDDATSVLGGLATTPTTSVQQMSQQTPGSAQQLLAVPPGASPTPASSLLTALLPAPIYHSIPVFERTDWLWEAAGTAPSQWQSKPGVIEAAGGWKEFYDGQLGWVAYQPAASAVPFYVLTAHPVFKTVPVLVGWGPASDSLTWDDAVALYPASTTAASQTVSTAAPSATDAAAATAPHTCKSSHAFQEYDTTFFLAPEKFVFRTNFDARWCFYPTIHYATWDKDLSHLNVPPAEIGAFWNPFVDNNGRFFHGAPGFTAKGHHNGGTYINAWYNMQEVAPTKLIGITIRTWTDELAIAGTYTGHWNRCSTNNSGLKRVGGSNDNATCAKVRVNINGGWYPPHD